VFRYTTPHALARLVDLLGGVEFDVPRDVDYENPYQNLYLPLLFEVTSAFGT